MDILKKNESKRNEKCKKRLSGNPDNRFGI